MTRFLIVRLGALGDIVHAIPVAAALRRAFPASRIDWLVSSRHREILDLVPAIDRRLAIADWGNGSGASLLSAVRELRAAHYDAALDLQGLIKSALIARSSGAARVIGFASRYLREPLARLFYSEVHDPGGAGIYAPSETRHVVDINLGLLARLDVPAAPPEFSLDAPSSPAARLVLEQSGGRYALLNPCAAWSNKRWPAAKLAALARALKERQGLASVILWGRGERQLAETVVRGAAGAAIIAPETTIVDVVALARGAAVMVSGDTGPAHIGAAVGTPLVGIYGPTRPERNGPWLAEDETVSRASMCQCHHLRECRRGRMCLEEIEVDEVLAAVERRLHGAAAQIRPAEAEQGA